MIFVETQKNNKRKAKQPPIAVYICIFILISLYGAIGFAAFIGAGIALRRRQ
mgnify:CR=1 FL=1